MLRPYIAVILAVSLAICSTLISCASKTDNFIARDLTITPSEAEVGEYILFEFWMENKGYRGVIATWALEIDGEEVQSKRISAEERATTRAYFRTTAEEVGEHSVVIRQDDNFYLTGKYKVVEPQP